jgi:hypothetical protein
LSSGASREHLRHPRTAQGEEGAHVEQEQSTGDAGILEEAPGGEGQMSDTPKTFIEYKPTHPAYVLLLQWLERHEQAYQRREADFESEYQIEAYLELIRQDYLAYLRIHLEQMQTPADKKVVSETQITDN